MQKIIDQVQDNSNILGYVRTKKVVEILENNKRKSGKSGRYSIIQSGDMAFIGNISKIQTLAKVLVFLGQSFTRGENHTRDWMKVRKREKKEGKLNDVYFL